MSHRCSPVTMHNVRRAAARMAMALFALLLAAGPLLRPQPAQAQIPLGPCPIPRGPEYIVQDCPRWGIVVGDPQVSLYLRQLEAQAVDEILVRHRLGGADDRQRLLTWERDLIRAALFDKLLGIIQKPAAQRSAIEQSVVANLTHMVQQPRIEAAEAALDYYNDWAADPCRWEAPPEFDDYATTCSPLANLFGGPKPPDFEQFQAYGAHHVLNSRESSLEFQTVAGNTAANLATIRGYAYGVGLPAAALSGGIMGAAVSNTGFFLKSVYPNFGRLIENLARRAVVEVGIRTIPRASILLRGLSTGSGVAAIITLAVVTAVTEGMAVFAAAELPNKLREAYRQARNSPPDLAQLMRTEAGVQEIFHSFLLLTLPDYPPANTPSGQDSAAGLFHFYDSTGARIPATPSDGTIRYRDWLGLAHTAWMQGSWFVDEYTDETGAFQRRMTLDLNYVNSDGTAMSAWRTGDQFLHTQVGDDNVPFVNNSLTFLNASGTLTTVSLPPPTPDLAIVTMRHSHLRRTYTTDFVFSDTETRYYWTLEERTGGGVRRVPGKFFSYDFASSPSTSDLVVISGIPVVLEVEAVLNGVVVGRQSTKIEEYVYNASPVVERATVTPAGAPVREGDPVTVAATFADDSDEFVCEVDFGDHTGKTPGVVTGNTCSASHSYTLQGAYEPKLYLSDRQFVSYNYAPVVTVVPGPPAITDLRLRFDNASGKVVLDVDFSDADPDRHAVEIDWGNDHTWRASLAGGVRTYSTDHSHAVGSNSPSISVTVWDWDNLSHRKGIALTRPTITGASELTVPAGQPMSHTVRGGGMPLPGFRVEGALPAGVQLANNNDGTASLVGTPAVGSGGVYQVRLIAANGTALAAAVMNFTLRVADAPAIVSPNNATFYTQQHNSFSVAMRGASANQVTLTGALPNGVFFSTANGQAGLGGTPAANTEGTYRLSFNIVQNGATVATQPFVLTVARGSAPPPWVNIGATPYVFTTPTVTMPFNGGSEFNIPIVGFECALDNLNAFAPCTSPHAMMVNDEGVRHTFYVRAVDQRGVRSNPPASRIFEVRVPPRANPQQAPAANAAGWNNSDVTVTWNWSDNGRLGAGCLPTSVSRGEGVLPIVATCRDQSGASATVTHTVKVDKGAPETTLSAPARAGRDITFAFAGTDAMAGVASFACSLDGAAFAPCTSPKAYSGLADGSHSFAVRALDAAGNADASPASHSWTLGAPGATPTPTTGDTLIGSCGSYTVYRNAQGQYRAAGWSGTISVGSEGNNALNGTSGADLMLGLGGDDKLDGKGGDDVLCGGDGRDVLKGQAGNDWADGGAGDDTLEGGHGLDQLSGGAGNDTLKGNDEADTLRGGDGNDTIDGSGDNDQLFGEAGDDRLTGGAGADRFDGGPNTDTASDLKPSQGDTQVNVP